MKTDHDEATDSIRVYGERRTAPLISIGVPTYKRPDLLRETLRSIAAQTGDHDYEVIVCDNGGLPETKEVLAEFPADRFSLYVNTPPCSMIENWNRCLRHARGQWVSVLHDDDMLFPWYFDTLCPLLGADVAAVYCLTVKGKELPVRERPVKAPSVSVYLPGYFLKNSMTAFPGVLLRNTFAREIGGFDTRWVTVADYQFWYRLSCRGKLLKAHIAAAFYRVHGDQGTQSVWPLLIREGHLMRRQIARERFGDSRLSVWIARYFTYRGAVGLGRHFSSSHSNVLRALKFKKIRGTWLPRGWVWGLVKLLARFSKKPER